MLLDSPQRVLGVEAAPQDQRRGGRQAHDEVEEAPGVEERRRDDHRLATAVGDLVDQRRDGEKPVGAGALRPLRRASRPRGEDDEARFVWRRLQVGVPGGGDQRVERRRLGIALGPADHPLDAAVDPVEQILELFVVDERFGSLATRHLDQLGPGEHRVQVEGAGAELGGRERRLDEAAVVATHDPDPVAVADPHPRESPGEGVAASVQLVEGERAAFVDQRRLVRVVDRGSRDAEGRRGAPAQKGGDDLRGLVGAVQAEDAGLVQHPDLERFVRRGLARRRRYGAEFAHRATKPIRSPPKPPLCRRSPRPGRSSPYPRSRSP